MKTFLINEFASQYHRGTHGQTQLLIIVLTSSYVHLFGIYFLILLRIFKLT